jgi:hypothetical protein
MNCLELKSPHEGSLLTFTIISRFEEGIDFNVRVETPFSQAMRLHRHLWQFRWQRGLRRWPVIGRAGKAKKSGVTLSVVFC